MQITARTGLTPTVTINAGSGAYVPSTPTVAVNDVIRFIPGSSVHDITGENNAFQTPLGQEACLRFTAAGSFPIHCSVHFFTGTITVTAN